MTKKREARHSSIIVAILVLISCAESKNISGEWKPRDITDSSAIKRIEITKTHYPVPDLKYLVNYMEGTSPQVLTCDGNDVHLNCIIDKSVVMVLVLNGDILTVNYKNKEFKFIKDNVVTGDKN